MAEHEAELLAALSVLPDFAGLSACEARITRLGGLTNLVHRVEARGQAVRMANPEVLHASGHMREHEEASPNLPGVSAVIKRPRAVTVRFLNDQGALEERDFVGLWATSAQHQVDHLAGKMYFDRLSPLKRKMLIAKAEKLGRRT